MSSNGTAQTNSQTSQLPNLGPRFLEHHSGFSNFFKRFLVPSHPACGSCFKNGMLPIAVTKELLMLKGQQFTIIYKRSLGWLLKGSECQAARQPSTKLWGWMNLLPWPLMSKDVVDELWVHAEDSWNQPMADFLPWFLGCIILMPTFQRQRNGLRWIWLNNKSEEKAARLVMLVLLVLWRQIFTMQVLAVWRPSHLKLIHSASSCLSRILYQFLMPW